MSSSAHNHWHHPSCSKCVRLSNCFFTLLMILQWIVARLFRADAVTVDLFNLGLFFFKSFWHRTKTHKQPRTSVFLLWWEKRVKWVKVAFILCPHLSTAALIGSVENMTSGWTQDSAFFLWDGITCIEFKHYLLVFYSLMTTCNNDFVLYIMQKKPPTLAWQLRGTERASPDSRGRGNKEKRLTCETLWHTTTYSVCLYSGCLNIIYKALSLKKRLKEKI